MPSTSGIVIRDYRAADRDRAVEVLVDSFIGFPALEVVVGSDAGARSRLARLFAMEFEPGARTSAIVAEMDGRLAGVLTWADRPDCSSATAARTLRFLRIAGPRVFATLRLFGRIEKLHPASPHRHLPSIGIDPPLQGQGVGARLMASFSEGCDRVSLEGYLETIRWKDPHRPSHRRFYERAGFRLADELSVDGDWSVVTMRRPPREPSGGGGR